MGCVRKLQPSLSSLSSSRLCLTVAVAGKLFDSQANNFSPLSPASYRPAGCEVCDAPAPPLPPHPCLFFHLPGEPGTEQKQVSGYSSCGSGHPTARELVSMIQEPPEELAEAFKPALIGHQSRGAEPDALVLNPLPLRIAEDIMIWFLRTEHFVSI
ncbi:hypothetical protein ILYODFUR_026994 [Ilyodon furcidens]|uniref:Uncharacterized protein n=1 Tax=Ilyodon furcidens TaxID=33524 RepID=A0ABV0U969_9TELE